MGAFTTKKNVITICDENNWDPGEFCTARTVVLSGDEEWVMNQQMLIQMPKGNRQQRRTGGFRKQQDAKIEFKNQMGAARRLWVQKMLESWTFFDDDGQIIPFTKSGQNEVDDRRMSKVMQFLKQEYIDFIFEAIQDAQPAEVKQAEQEEEDDEQGDDEEEGSPFFGNVSPSIAGNTDEDEDEEQVMLLREMMNPTTKGNRNFLAKS